MKSEPIWAKFKQTILVIWLLFSYFLFSTILGEILHGCVVSKLFNLVLCDIRLSVSWLNDIPQNISIAGGNNYNSYDKVPKKKGTPLWVLL